MSPNGFIFILSSWRRYLGRYTGFQVKFTLTQLKPVKSILHTIKSSAQYFQFRVATSFVHNTIRKNSNRRRIQGRGRGQVTFFLFGFRKCYLLSTVLPSPKSRKPKSWIRLWLCTNKGPISINCL